jgi:hypothetical protein
MTIFLVSTRILEMYTLYTITGLPELDLTRNLPLYFCGDISTIICCTKNVTPTVELHSALNETGALLFLEKSIFRAQNLRKINHTGVAREYGE